MSAAVLLLAALALPSAAWQGAKAGGAASLDDYVHAFEISYRSVRSLRANFTQTYETGGRTRVESGTVTFARGGLMRWDYGQPRQKLFVSDGKHLLLYIPEEKQLTRSPVKSSEDIRVPFRLLLSRINLRRVFSKIEFADSAMPHDPDDRVLRAFPKKGYEEDYQQVLMELAPGFDIRRLVVVYPDGSRMNFSFEQITRNAPVSRGFFQFTPPQGTEVIDQK